MTTRRARDYSKGFIYKLTSKDVNVKEIYVGSSTNMKQRKKGHKDNCYNENSDKYNLKVYKYIRDNGGWSNWSMIWIKNFPCNSKRELETEEDKIMKKLNARLNMIGAVMDKEKRKSKQKEYRDTHKEAKTKTDKIYRENNKDKIQSYFKEHYKNNKEHKIKYADDYRISNREEINKKQNEVITCECGSKSNKGALSRHKKSKKHQAYEFLKYIEESL